MLLDLRSLYEVQVIRPVRVGGGYPHPVQVQRIPARLDPALWLALYAAGAINEEELAALLAAK